MAELAIKVQNFEGPLELLLHLTEKDKIDIYDIPIASVTEQYIAYLEAMAEFDMEVASEFLLMAAMLLQIKSRMLLPKKEFESESDEEADPRQMLVEMLVEYRKIKDIAKRLEVMKSEAARYIGRRPLLPEKRKKLTGSYPVAVLVECMLNLLATQEETVAYIERQTFSVQEKMAEIMHLLKHRLNGIEFKELIAKTGSRSEKVASFLALLELLKLNVISITQTVAFAPIYIFLHREEHSDVS